MKGKFETIVSGEKPVLVDFHATWCGPCKMLSPILKELSAEMKEQLRIIKIDIDKNQELSQKLNVRGVPTLILYKGGEPIWRQSGLLTKVQLKNQIESLLN